MSQNMRFLTYILKIGVKQDENLIPFELPSNLL